MMDRHGPAMHAGIAFFLYALLTALFFHAFLPHIATSLPGPPEDNLMDFWNSWYFVTAQQHGGSFYQTRMLTFPEGASLYFHTFAYPRLALVWLGTGIFGSERETLIILHNVTHLLSFPLSGLGAYLLVRKFTGETLSALAGGFVFAFNPSRVQHALHHVGITSIEFFPFFALFYWQAIERRSAVWLAAAVLCMAMASLSSLYYFFYCGYFMLFHMAAMAWKSRTWPRGWSLAAPVLTGLAVLMLLMPLVIPMMRQMTSGDFSYPPGHATFVIDLAAYALFSPHHVFGPLTGPFYRFILHGNPWEAAGYLGLANIALFVWIWNNRNDSQDWFLRYCLAGMLFFGALAAGSYLRIFGLPTLPMPTLLLSELPFLKSLRAPSRAVVFVYLFLAIGVGLAIRLALQRIGAEKRLHWALAGLLAVIALDFYPAHYRTTPMACAPGLGVIRSDPDRDFGVLNMPRGQEADNAALAEQTCHWRPVVLGEVARATALTLRDKLETSDMQAQRRQLTEAKVKYILLRREDDGIRRWRENDGRPGDYLSTYRTVHSQGNLVILQVY